MSNLVFAFGIWLVLAEIHPGRVASNFAFKVWMVMLVCAVVIDVLRLVNWWQTR